MADKSGYIGRSPGDSSVTIARQTNTAAGAETTFVFNSGYDVGYLDVYLNGSKLINAIDYTATDTQNVTLTTATSAGDVLEFVAYKAFNVTQPITSADSLEVIGQLTANSAVITNDLSVGGSISGEGSAITGIVTTLTAGDNISLSGSTGSVTITGLGQTANISADSLVVSGISTLGIVTSVTSVQSTIFYGNVTGNVTGDLTGTASEATEASAAKSGSALETSINSKTSPGKAIALSMVFG